MLNKSHGRFLRGSVRAWCFELSIAMLRPRSRTLSLEALKAIHERCLLLQRADGAIATSAAAQEIDPQVLS